MYRILICDDQKIVCEGLQTIINADPDLEVVGISHDGAQALDAIPALQPNLILMDLSFHLPHPRGLVAVIQILQHNEVIWLGWTNFNLRHLRSCYSVIIRTGITHGAIKRFSLSATTRRNK